MPHWQCRTNQDAGSGLLIAGQASHWRADPVEPNRPEIERIEFQVARQTDVSLPAGRRPLTQTNTSECPGPAAPQQGHQVARSGGITAKRRSNRTSARPGTTKPCPKGPRQANNLEGRIDASTRFPERGQGPLPSVSKTSVAPVSRQPGTRRATGRRRRSGRTDHAGRPSPLDRSRPHLVSASLIDRGMPGNVGPRHTWLHRTRKGASGSPDGTLPVADRAYGSWMSLVSWNSSNPSMPPSRPRPDCL